MPYFSECPLVLWRAAHDEDRDKVAHAQWCEKGRDGYAGIPEMAIAVPASACIPHMSILSRCPCCRSCTAHTREGTGDKIE